MTEKREHCVVCGEEHGIEDLHVLDVKGKQKNVCKQCVMAIKGFA